MHFKLFLLNIGRVLHFYYGQQFVHANDTGVCRLCHSVFFQRTVQVQVHVWIDMGVCGLWYDMFIQRTVEVQVWGNARISGIRPNSGFQRRGDRESHRLRKVQLLHWEEYSDIHVQIFEVHSVVVICACTTWGHISTYFWPTMYMCGNGPQPIP